MIYAYGLLIDTNKLYGILYGIYSICKQTIWYYKIILVVVMIDILVHNFLNFL